MKLSFEISVNLELAKDLSENTDMSEHLQNLQALTDSVCVCVFKNPCTIICCFSKDLQRCDFAGEAAGD